MSMVLILIVKGLCSMCIVKANHPVTLAGLLLAVSLTGSAILGLMGCSWLFYLLMLVFLGGVMVVLLFMVSICANEKFIFSGSSHFPLIVVLALLTLFSLNTSAGPTGGFSSYFMSLSLYQTDCGMIFIMFMLYLVLCLISVVSISKLEAGPLVKRL